METLRTEKLTQAGLRHLADTRPDVTVYEHVYDEPEAIMPDAIQLKTYREIVDAFDDASRRYMGERDEALRERVLNGLGPEARLFQRLYSKAFAQVTVTALTAADEERLDCTRKALMSMILERAVGEGGADMKAARAMNTCMRMALRPTREEDVATGTTLSTGDGAEVDPAVLDAVKPLHRLDMGPTSVRQGRKF